MKRQTEKKKQNACQKKKKKKKGKENIIELKFKTEMNTTLSKRIKKKKEMQFVQTIIKE
jgi:hypothetical protein